MPRIDAALEQVFRRALDEEFDTAWLLPDGAEQACDAFHRRFFGGTLSVGCSEEDIDTLLDFSCRVYLEYVPADLFVTADRLPEPLPEHSHVENPVSVLRRRGSCSHPFCGTGAFLARTDRGMANVPVLPNDTAQTLADKD
ncbi:TPA: hypothetical protein SLV10_001741 [Pseudomonas aeruginosa]|nr:hypothetical protein [Pseudomonas aeruginosa]